MKLSLKFFCIAYIITLLSAGLGLSLCKEIAEIHGTSLCFESEKGKGTAVSFALRKGGAENENT